MRNEHRVLARKPDEIGLLKHRSVDRRVIKKNLNEISLKSVD